MEDLEDFTYLVTIPGGPVFHFREVTPKDFYLAQVLRQADRSQVFLVERLLLNSSILDEVTSTHARQAIEWAMETLLNKSILTVENWLELAFHLCKQRWDQSVDWLESQPMSKINAMLSIVKHHAEEQEKMMKKKGKKK